MYCCCASADRPGWRRSGRRWGLYAARRSRRAVHQPVHVPFADRQRQAGMEAMAIMTFTPPRTAGCSLRVSSVIADHHRRASASTRAAGGSRSGPRRRRTGGSSPPATGSPTALSHPCDSGVGSTTRRSLGPAHGTKGSQVVSSSDGSCPLGGLSRCPPPSPRSHRGSPG